MKLLLDEMLPKRLKADFHEHEVYTIREKGWNRLKNGELLQLMIKNNFDALLTFDKNLQFQQNFVKYSITVFVLSAQNNTYLEMAKLSMLVKEYLKKENLKKGTIVISESSNG